MGVNGPTNGEWDKWSVDPDFPWPTFASMVSLQLSRQTS